MKLILIPILLCMFYCNNKQDNSMKREIEKNKKLNNKTDKKVSPFNTFNDGGMNINFEDFINENKIKIKTEINKYNYKIPENNIFEEKIKFYFNWDIQDYTNVIVLENSMFPVIVVKDYNLIYLEDDNGEEINGQLISNYNKLIFYDDKASLTWLKFQYPYLLDSLVKTYGFSKNDDILKFVFNRTNFNNDLVISDFIFQSNDGILTLREDMIRKIREIKFNNEISNDYGVVVGTDFYSSFLDIIKNIRREPNNYEKSDYQIAFLLNEVILSGLSGIIDSELDKNPQYKRVLKSNHYFNFQRLKEYVEHIYGQNPNSFNEEVIYKIQDPDGYTNLRREKNSTSDIIEKIKSGERIYVLDDSSNWWFIQTISGNKGYVYKTKIKS